ncbi:MAG: hypothetical protein LIP08_10725 [Bacteroides sp.]|nr:hypothetical protein [Bacteroides sp.]
MKKQWTILLTCLAMVCIPAQAGNLSNHLMENESTDAGTCQVTLSIDPQSSLPILTDLVVSLNNKEVFDLAANTIMVTGDPVQTFNQGAAVTLKIVRNHSEYDYRIYINNVAMGYVTASDRTFTYAVNTNQESVDLQIRIIAE